MDKQELEKMHNGELYLPEDEDIAREQIKCLDKLYDYNRTRPTEMVKRQLMLKDMFAEIGEDCYIEPPLHANWGGKFAHFGNHVHAGTNLTLGDDTHIYVGDDTRIGPNVTIATSGYPIQPELRKQGYQYNAQIIIGKNCWIGAGTIIQPGVMIGDNAVIVAGSVVASDIPANVVAAGNPCKVLREVGEQDSKYYFKDHRIDFFQYNNVTKKD